MKTPLAITANRLRRELRTRDAYTTAAIAIALAATPGLLSEFLAQTRENRRPTESAKPTP